VRFEEREVRDVPGEARRPQSRQEAQASLAGRSKTERTLGGRLELETLRGPRQSPTGGREGDSSGAVAGGRRGEVPRDVVPRRYAAPPGRRLAAFEGKKVVELFSGSARLARSIAQHGIDCEAWDIIDGPDADLLALSNRKRLLRDMRRGRVVFIWMGFPCTNWSMARRFTRSGPGALRDAGPGLWGLPDLSDRDQAKVDLGNRLLRVTAAIAKEAIRLRIPFALENQKYSRAWLTEPLQYLMRKGAEFYETHYCQFNEPWRKATRLLCFLAPSLQHVLRVCTGMKGICSATGLKHLQLNGLDEHDVFWTLRAQAYPQSMCSALARAIREQVRCWDSIAPYR